MARKPTDFVQFKLRIREALRRKLESEAAKKKHSANAEAVARIERTFAADEAVPAHIEALKKAELDLREAGLRAKLAFEANVRDTEILNTMVENKSEGARLLRVLAREIASHPEWPATIESKKAFADRLHWIVTNEGFAKGASE
jgi:hypothetical protein